MIFVSTRTIILISFCVEIIFSESYLPIVFFHGLNDNYKRFNNPTKWIQEKHPGTEIYSLSYFPHAQSYESILKQAPVVKEKFEDLLRNNITSDYILMSHSQGSILARYVLQSVDNHRCNTWISLAGVLSGQFGVPEIALPQKWEYLKKLSLEAVSKIMYVNVTQNELSFANYWKDPMNCDSYLENNMFLPYLNNETYNKESERMKKNFKSLQQLVLFGSPFDKVIRPWQGEHFGFYKCGSVKDIVEMEATDIYLKDYFGLKTMNEQGKIQRITVEGVSHVAWLDDQDIFMDNVFPHLK